jgi:hypothetical protein
MIRSFADRDTERLFSRRFSRRATFRRPHQEAERLTPR